MSQFLRVGSALLLAALFAGVACSEPTGQDINGETHFLRTCRAGSTDCGQGLTCACGVCTRGCTDSSDCSAFPVAACVDSTTATTPDACDESAPAGHCDVTCGTDADCSALAGGHACRLGFCRSASSTDGSAGSSGTGGSGGTGGSSGTTGTSGSGGTGGGGTGGDVGGAAGDEAGAAGDLNGAGGEDGCVRGQVTGNQVVVLGDSFMALNHEITAGIEGLSRAAGALSAGQRYRDESTLMSNALALGGNGILAQYSRAASEAAVKVAIMNGGGADVLVGYCPAPPSSACPVITAAVAGARDVFARMAADGVEQVIYAFYPDPEDSPLREKMDVFRPLAEAACLESPVPCHWLDLRPVFEGHYAEYVVPEGLNPTSEGALATADAIWATMQAQCIAQ